MGGSEKPGPACEPPIGSSSRWTLQQCGLRIPTSEEGPRSMTRKGGSNVPSATSEAPEAGSGPPHRRESTPGCLLCAEQNRARLAVLGSWHRDSWQLNPGGVWGSPVVLTGHQGQRIPAPQGDRAAPHGKGPHPTHVCRTWTLIPSS